MPRLSPHLIRRAAHLNPSLVPVLRQCRDWTSAQNEFRWLKEHAWSLYGFDVSTTQPQARRRKHAEQHLTKLCAARGRGYPLQYILGTEYFGDLELVVKPGVLIPRRETAVAIEYLARRFLADGDNAMPLSVLDLCTGTGCISHLLWHLLRASHSRELDVLGVDISPTALSLARLNARRLRAVSTAKDGPRFELADVLRTAEGRTHEQSVPSVRELLHELGKPSWDIVVANPPYISPAGFARDTERSVRNFEPKLALVPTADYNSTETIQEDIFYPRVLDVAQEVGARIVWIEVGGLEQANRVAAYMARRPLWPNIEIWRDDPRRQSPRGTSPSKRDATAIIGKGHGRSVVCWREAS